MFCAALISLGRAGWGSPTPPKRWMGNAFDKSENKTFKEEISVQKGYCIIVRK